MEHSGQKLTAVAIPSTGAAPWPWLRAKQRKLSERGAHRLVGLLVALSVGLLLSRTWKLISITLVEDAAWGIPVRRRALQALVVLLAIGGALVVRRWLERRGVRTRYWLLGLAVLGLAAGELRERITTGNAWWFIDRTVGRALMPVHVYRGDLTLIVGFCLLAALLLSGGRGDARWRTRLLQLLAAFILLLTGVELAYFHSTAMVGDGFIVTFWLKHLRSIGFLIQSEMSLANVGLILGYPLLVPLCGWLAERRALGHSLQRSWQTRPVLALAPLFVLVLWLTPDHAANTYAHKRIASQFHGRTVTDWAGMVVSQETEAAAEGQPNAEFEKLRLIATPETKRLNVVFIILESVRASSVSPYNQQLQTTPFFAELSSKSLLVDDMHAVIPATAKAWTAIFSGIYPVSTMAAALSESSQVGGSLPSLPRLLRQHGYRSAFFTPAHLKFEQDEDVIENRAFDVVKSEGDYSTEGFERSNYYGHEDRIMLRPSLDWVDEMTRQGHPFFLSYMTLTAHHDYQVPKSFQKVQYPGVKDESLNDYLNCLRYIDDWMRDIFAEFEARKLLESTVFVILGDHGQSFGEHGTLQHVSVIYDEATHVPALIHAPALGPQVGHITGPRQQVDLLPTVAALLGYRLEGGYLPGVSLLEPVPAERELYFTCWQDRTCIGMKSGPMKYIYWYATDTFQAFDLAKDPGERRDLSATLSADRIRELRQKMATWQARSLRTYLPNH